MTTIVDGQAGITFNDASVQGTAGYTGFRNRIINGAMVIDQRNAGAAVTATSNGAFPVDRFRTGGSSFGQTLSLQQVSDAPSGLVSSLKVTVSVAVPSPGATAQCAISHLIEGYNTVDFAWGTGSAKTVTLSFWVKASIAGTYSVTVSNNDTTSYIAQYTVSTANQWQYQSIAIPGSSTGVWATTNGTGVRLDWNLGTGANYTSSAGSWLTASSGNYYLNAAGTVQLVQTTSATWQITSAQLELGGVATPFERRQFGTELALCQRYYTKLSSNSSYTPFGTGHGVTSTSFRTMFNLPVPMRAAQTVSYGGTFIWAFGNSTTLNALAAWGPTTASMDCTSTGITAFYCYTLTDAGSNNSYIAFSAEL